MPALQGAPRAVLCEPPVRSGVPASACRRAIRPSAHPSKLAAEEMQPALHCLPVEIAPLQQSPAGVRIEGLATVEHAAIVEHDHLTG